MAGPPDSSTGVAAAPLIRVQAVSRAFGNRTALSDVSFEVLPQEIFGVVGPDGAGKTTLLQILAAILDPTSGDCSVLGFDTRREDAAINARVGYMSQGFTLYGRLSVAENLKFAGKIHGVPEPEYRARAQRLLDMAGLTPFQARWAERLSGGMRKKLSLCCSLIHKPPLLLLDELSLGVDPLSRRELWNMLRGFRNEGVSVVLTTPYMDEAKGCDRLCFLDSGRLLTVDTPYQLEQRAQSTSFELSGDDLALAPALLATAPEVAEVRLAAGTVHVRTLSPEGLTAATRARLPAGIRVESIPLTLEDAFLQLSESHGAALPAEALASVSEPSDPAVPAVALSGVTCKFGEFTAVDNVTMMVRRGEVFGFLGPNGAGKTTLIRAMCGMLRPTAGAVRVAGIDAAREPRRLASRIGYMSQQFSLYPDLTCAENLSFFGGIYGLKGRDKKSAIRESAHMLGLDSELDRGVAELSGAVRQRLALACSLLHEPQVVFLDEPTSGVDPASRRRFWRLIRNLAASGVTVFVTTHHLVEAENCDRLGLMSAGRLLAYGSIRELKSELHLGENTTIEEVFVAYISRDAISRDGSS